MKASEAMQMPEYQLVSAAANNDMKKVKALLADGVDISSHEPLYGRTALHAACSQGLKKMIPFLIDAGAPLNALDDNAMTPLMCACVTGKKKGSEIALMLMDAGADVTYVREDDDMSAISFASWGQCSKEVMDRLIDLGAEPLPKDFKNIHV
jgi:ankyrin repeat protein